MKLHLLIKDRIATAARPCDNDKLLRSLRAGSVDAMATFYDRNHERVRTLARRLLGDDAAAEDVVQEVFATFPRAAGHYRGDCDLQSFLLGIAVKKARSHLRLTIRRRRLLERYSREERPGPRDPEQDAYRRELARRLVWALDRISPAHREAFVLCEIQDLPATLAAEILGIPEATVRTRLFHGRTQLRVLLSDEAMS
jgi:RNA polymerase sigma-70 factor (ECF subfamily)